MAYTQDNRKLSVDTPLGKDVLLFRGLRGSEGISRLFSFEVLALAENKTKVAFDSLLGKKVTVKMKMGEEETPTYLNGLCSRVSQGGRDEDFTTYRLTLVPELWLLTRKSRSKTFQQKDVPTILREVFEGLEVDYRLSGTYEKRDYCVQYRETDYHFASRLMEEEGIFFFFEHEDGSHKTVVADAPEGHGDVAEPTAVTYEELVGGFRAEERVYSWEKVQELRSGKVTLWDHTFQLPHKHLEAEQPIIESIRVGTVTHKLKVGGNDELELYDWPGDYAQRRDGIDTGGGERASDLQKVFDDSKRTAEIRMDEETLPAILIRGETNAKHFRSGHKFTLRDHFNADGSYVLAECIVDAEQTGDYRTGASELRFACSFTCIPSDLKFRPPRKTPKPIVAGTQSAVVVGPSGEEIFTDKYGRVKVQFHWDREGNNDEESSCWIRVAQLMAGRRWGTSFWPRIGQEVVVAFDGGDPDCPVIVGAVYNPDQMPPYLGNGPDGKHRNDNKVSGFKSNTTMGGAGFNEWRFDDTKGKEQIFIHAQGSMDVRVNGSSKESVGSRHLTVGSNFEGDHRELIHGSKHLKVVGSRQEWIAGDAKLTVGTGQSAGNQEIVIHGNKAERVCGESSSLIVDGDALSYTVGFSHHRIGHSAHVMVRQEAILDATYVYILADRIHVSASERLQLKGGAAGGSFISLDDSGVVIKGPNVDINCEQATPPPVEPPALREPVVPTDAAPADPAGADSAQTGQKSAPDSGR